MTMICQICGTRSTLLVGPCIECAAATLPPPAVDIPTDGLMLPAEFRVTPSPAAVTPPHPAVPEDAVPLDATTLNEPAPASPDTVPGLMFVSPSHGGAPHSASSTDPVGDLGTVGSSAADVRENGVSDEVEPLAPLARQRGPSTQWKLPVWAALVLCTALAVIWGTGRPTTGSGAPNEAAAPGAVSPVAAVDLPALSVTSPGEAMRASSSPADPVSAAMASPGSAGTTTAAVPVRKNKEQIARKSVLAHASSPSGEAQVPSAEGSPELQQAPAAPMDPVPQAVADPSGNDPRQVCSGGNFFSRAVCMNNRCAQSAYAGHDECVRLRKVAEDAEMSSLRGG